MYCLTVAQLALLSVSCHILLLRTHSVLDERREAVASPLSQQLIEFPADLQLPASDSTDLGHLCQNHNSQQPPLRFATEIITVTTANLTIKNNHFYIFRPPEGRPYIQ